jgi:glycosyltransferase involved in cell wall biosynthesis
MYSESSASNIAQDKRLSVSVVMASYNEEKAIGPMIQSIREHTSQYNTEIVLVDSSKDKTPEIAESMGAKVYRQPPKGHGTALREGILRASNDYVVTSDCDCTYPMDRIADFVSLLHKDGYDLVSGNRLSGSLAGKMPLTNRIANFSFALIVRILYGIKTHDVTTGMFGFKRNLIQAIQWETNYAFPAEIIIRTSKARFNYKEIPIKYEIRIGEVTLNKWRSGKAYLLCFLKYKFFSGISVDKL